MAGGARRHRERSDSKQATDRQKRKREYVDRENAETGESAFEGRRRSVLLLVLGLELLDELAHLGVPVVEHPLHVVGDLRGVGRFVDVVVAALLVVDLFFLDESGLEESLDG